MCWSIFIFRNDCSCFYLVLDQMQWKKILLTMSNIFGDFGDKKTHGHPPNNEKNFVLEKTVQNPFSAIFFIVWGVAMSFFVTKVSKDV